MNWDKQFDIRNWCVNIEEAASQVPEFKVFVNDGKIDFGDPLALRAYNQAIALVLLGLKITVPQENLIPTICLRYAYVKIMKELLEPKEILEIGTGASAIISLIASRLGMKATATEIDPKSYQSALHNIQQNDPAVVLIKSNGGIIKGVIDGKFNLLLTYPPIYPTSDTVSIEKGRNRGFKGTRFEMIGGGETGLKFVTQLIKEAKSTRICEYISLLLIKSNQATYVAHQLETFCTDVTIVKLDVGTRKRFIVYGKLKMIINNMHPL